MEVPHVNSFWQTGEGRTEKKTPKQYLNRAQSRVEGAYRILILISFLSFFFPFLAFGEVSPPSLPSLTPSSAEKPLEVLFVDGLLSVTAQNATLKALSDTIAQKTGIDISLSPTLEAVVVSVQFTNVDVETGLKEILRVAGVASYAWTYRRGHQPREMGEWVLSRMDIVAEGPKTGQPPASTATPPASTASPEAPPSRIVGKGAPNRESYFDARSKQFVEVVAREVMVRFRKELSDDEIKQIIQNLGAQVISQHEKLRFYRLKIPQSESVSGFIRKNQAHPDLPLIEPNYLASSMATGVVPNDPLFQNQWALERIKAADAWKVTTGDQDVVVAVIDTGVDSNHPDLQGKVLPGRNIIEQDENALDDHGHGTAIAGVIAAATDNNTGMAGVCWDCRLMPVKVLDASGEGSYADVIEGILWAVDSGARVLNLSLGGYAYSQFMADAVDYAHAAGAVLVAAGGNEATSDPLYPASFPNVIGVSATDSSDRIWTASNSGSYIKLSAPGVDILSTGLTDGYVTATGTSLAVAHVSGVAALVFSQNLDLSNTQVEQIFYQTAEDLGEEGRDEVYGFGRTNAAEALGMASIEVHDVAVVGIRVEPQTFQVGETIQIVVTVQNQGTFVENDLLVHAFVNNKPVEVGQRIWSVKPGRVVEVNFAWTLRPTQTNELIFRIEGEISTVEGEVNVEDNVRLREFFGSEQGGIVVIKHKIHPPVHQHMAVEALKLLPANEGIRKELEENNNNLRGDLSDFPADRSDHTDHNTDTATNLLNGVHDEDLSDPNNICGLLNGRYYRHGWNPDGGYGDGFFLCKSAVETAQDIYWPEAKRAYEGGDKQQAYWWLGRIVHLMGDMSVPAHVHKDIHPDRLGNDDQYEEWARKDDLSWPHILHLHSHDCDDTDINDNACNFQKFSINNSGQYQHPEGTETIQPLNYADIDFDTFPYNTYNDSWIATYKTDAAVDKTSLFKIFLDMAEKADQYESDGEEGEDPDHPDDLGETSNLHLRWHARDLFKEGFRHIAGLYQLFWDATRFEPNDSSASAKTITPGLPQRHAIIPATDFDWVKFTLSTASDVIVETFGPSGDTRMWLYDANLDEIEFDLDSGNGNFSKISRSLASGTYYVKVDEFDNDNELSPYYISLTVNNPVSATWTIPPPPSVISGENFTVRWTTTGNPGHVNIHWNPTDPTSSNCCTGPANSTNDSTFSPTNSPKTLTAPTKHPDGTPITAPTTVKYVVHARDTGTGDEAYSTVAMVTVSPAPEAGTLAVSPGTGLSSAGQSGGPFSPPSQTYTLTNIGETSINWTAGKTQSWVTLSKSSGTLAAGGQDQVTVSINSAANSLAASGSPYSDTVTFTNTTNGNGSQTRIVSLAIISVVEHTLIITNAASGGPNPVIPRGTADLSVTATDSLGHGLSYAWTASCPTLSSNGNFTGSATRTPTWLAPENDTGSLQNCTLQVTVSDGLGQSQQSSYSHGVNPGGATSLSIVDGISLLEPPPYELNGTATVEATIKNTGSATVVLDRFQAVGEFTDQFGSVFQRTWPTEQFQPPLSLAPGASHQYTKLLDGGNSFPALATTAVVMIHVKFNNIAGQQPITNAESGATAQLVFEVGHTLNITNGPAGDPDPVVSGEAVNLSVAAADSLGHQSGYAWEASCPGLGANGIFNSTTIRTPTWTAPTNTTGIPQQCTIQVTVSDGTGLSQVGSYLQEVTQGVTSCAYSLSSTSKSFSPSAGSSSVNVITPNGCPWTAVSNDAWITITSVSSSDGPGTVNYAVAGNTVTIFRTGTLTIAEQTFTVTQTGVCTYSLSPTSQLFGPDAGTDSINVTAPSGCPWTATSNAAWITITSGSSGSDNGTVNYSVAANTAVNQRSGTISIQNQTFTVTQAGVGNDENFALVVNHSTVSIIDPDTDSVTGTVSLGNEAAGYGAAITPDGTKAYVTSNSSTSDISVHIVDISTRAVIDTIMLGGGGFGVAVTPDGTKAYVAHNLETVSVIDTTTDNVITPVTMGSNAWEVAITPDGSKVYVTNNSASGIVSVIDTTSDTLLTSITVGAFPLGIAITPDGTKVYVANGGSQSLSIIDTATNAVLGTVGGWSGTPKHIAITPDGTEAYVTTDSPLSVAVVNTDTDTVIDTITGIGSAGFVAITPDGTKAYVSMIGTSSVAVIDTLDRTVSDPILGMVSPKGIAMRFLPDLMISANVASSYTSGQAGAQIPVTVYRSGGNLTSGTYVPARLFWSTDPTWDTGDSQLWESNGSTPDYPISFLNTNGSKTVTATVNIPNIPSGTYHIIAFVDPPTNSFPSGFHTESNENNNTTSYPVSIPQQTGSLQVTISPQGAINAGAQWRVVDGGAWHNSGSTPLGLTVGNHTVEFKDISGWTKPGNQTVTINNSQTTTTTGTYTQQTGSLRVTLSPQGAINTGAQWRVNGGAWRNSGDTQAGLAIGNHTVEFKALTGWTKPGNQTVTINNSQTTTTAGTYTQQTGSLRVTLSPQGAINAGAQWRVDGGAWHNSGATQTGVPVGSHTVEFKALTGWTKPGNQTVTINNSQTTTTTGTYTQQTGSLRVTLSPQGAINAGAQWRVDGGAWHVSGATQTGVPVGSHTVAFKAISGWTEPADQTVTVSNGQTAAASGTYIQQTGAVQGTLSPQGALDAGAQWRVDGGAWRNSGDTQAGLAIGNHTVEFKAVSGWTKPGNQTVTINNSQTTTTSGTYTQQTGALQVTLSPQGALNAGAQWRVDGGAWRNSGDTQSGLSIGNHTVEYKAISGWTMPGSQVITISNGQTTTTSGTYIAHMCGTSPFDQAENWTLMDEVVTGDRNYRATYLIEAGPAFTVSSTGCVHFSAGEQVILHPGFRVEHGGTFKANIE